MFMTRIFTMHLSIMIISCTMNLSCGKKTKTGQSAGASLSMSNSTLNLDLTAAVACPSSAGYNSNTNCYTPTSYGVKMLNAYISPDQSGATSGPAGLIWSNPACSVSSQKSEINGKEFTYESVDSGCDDSKVSSYFELARATADVNAELNGKKYSILPGTYNYVQLGFCIGGAKSKNIQFQAEGMSAAYQVSQDSCGVSSTKADPPIVVGEGESVTISLAYDLKGVIVDVTSGGGTADSKCYSSGGVTRCIGPSISLTPSFSK
jgi:hypothetical protein